MFYFLILFFLRSYCYFNLDMSSVCSGGLDFKDAASASTPSNNGSSNHVSVTGSEDAQESDGDDSGNIHQYLNQESKDIPEPLPLKSSDDEGEDKNHLAKVVIFSQSVSSLLPSPYSKTSLQPTNSSFFLNL